MKTEQGKRLTTARGMVRVSVVAAVLAASALGCGGPQRSGSAQWTGLDETTGQNVTINQGPMPENQSFSGVYQSPQIGVVNLVQTGDAMIGRYEYDRGSCHITARLEGQVTGNLVRFSYTENHRECGRLAPVTGHGFFLYMVETVAEVTRGRIFGRWGYGEDDHSGGPWFGFKLPNRQPTMPDSTEADGGT